MIWIQTRRAGLICLAATANDLGHITQTWGLTRRSAERRLVAIDLAVSDPSWPTDEPVTQEADDDA